MKTKIIHFVMGKANPDNMNGVNKSAHNLAKFQARKGFPTEIWGVTQNPNSPTPDRDYPLRLFTRSKARFIVDRDLTKEIEKLPIGTIFHFHGVLIPEFFTVSRVLKKRGINWVVSPRGAYSPVALRRRKIPKLIYFWLFELDFLRGAFSIHALTRQEFDWVQNLFPNQKTMTIPNGEDKENLVFNYHKIDKKNRVAFGFCGRLEQEQKGLDILIEGFRRYLASGYKGELWLIGDGPSRKKLELFVASNNMGDDVKFLGKLVGDEKLNRIANMDLFVHCSRWEGIPNSVLEAAGLGVPLLLSEGTNMLNDLKKWRAGIALDENSSKSIEVAFKKFVGLGPNEINQYSVNCLKMIDEKYSYQKVALQLISDVYHLSVEP